jgi:hypothetical protein
MTSAQHQHMRQIIPMPQNRSNESQHHHYLVATQQAYDPEAALINTIVSHLANLNDDEVRFKFFKGTIRSEKSATIFVDNRRVHEEWSIFCFYSNRPRLRDKCM